MKKLFVILILVILLFKTGTASAYEKSAGASAVLASNSTGINVDNRTEILREYLKSWHSPLADQADTFVRSADEYGLDWRLVASIAGLESGFGKAIPYGSYNAWGWGIYGENVIRFNSWDEGIKTISKGLRERYLGENPDSDPYVIGPTYAASPTWAVRVASFMEQISEFEIKNGRNSLTLAI